MIVLQPLLAAALLIGLAFVLLVPVPPLLGRARWPRHAPRAALALWHGIAHTAGLSIVGACVALAIAPLAATYRHGLHVLLAQTLDGDPLRGLGPAQITVLGSALAVLGWLVALLVRTAVRHTRMHRSHRSKVDLLAESRVGDRGVRDSVPNGVRVIAHPTPVAYCLPGLRARVVISSGLVDLLTQAELAAVVDHERAHARGRHHLLLLPFTAGCRAVPWLPATRIAQRSTRQLAEMLADDHARRHHGGSTVAAALVRMAAHHAGKGTVAHPTPGMALPAAEHAVLTRLQRLLGPATVAPLWQRLLAYGATSALLFTPMALLVPCLA